MSRLFELFSVAHVMYLRATGKSLLSRIAMEVMIN